jgi:hypothetical protein
LGEKAALPGKYEKPRGVRRGEARSRGKVLLPTRQLRARGLPGNCERKPPQGPWRGKRAYPATARESPPQGSVEGVKGLPGNCERKPPQGPWRGVRGLPGNCERGAYPATASEGPTRQLREKAPPRSVEGDKGPTRQLRARGLPGKHEKPLASYLERLRAYPASTRSPRGSRGVREPTRQVFPFHIFFFPKTSARAERPTLQAWTLPRPGDPPPPRVGSTMYSIYSIHIYTHTYIYYTYTPQGLARPQVSEPDAQPATRQPVAGMRLFLGDLRPPSLPSPSGRCRWQTRKWGECLYSTKLAAGLRSVARNNKATRLLTRPG